MDHLSPYRLDLVIIRETAQRIIADFDFFGLTVTFSGREQTAYEELATQLVPFFDELQKNNRAKLMQVLYKIDISEPKLKSSLSKYEQASFSQVVTYLVIEREMQKVITRKLYSK